MAPRLGNNPTVGVSTEAWTEVAERVVVDEAGKDGRLTRAGAHRIGQRLGGERLWADNVHGFFDDTGQKSVSARKLIGLLATDFESSAREAAGPDGRLSLIDARRLPDRFQPDFLYLRGKGPVDPPVRTHEQLVADVRQAVLAAVDGGTAVQLPMPPWQVRGVRPLIEHLPHPASATHFRAFIADNVIYVARGANRPTPLVGWYRIGPVPPAAG